MKEKAVHVYPLNDLRPHTLEGLECECVPRFEERDGALVIVHTAWDMREVFEQAQLPKSEGRPD